MNNKAKYERNVINSLDEIPDFSSEDEERDFWAEHEFSPESLESMPDMTDELNRIAPIDESSQKQKRRAG